MFTYNKALRNIKVMLLSVSESEVDSLELVMLGCIEAVVLVGCGAVRSLCREARGYGQAVEKAEEGKSVKVYIISSRQRNISSLKH
jgi:hypothetical protein